MIGRWNRKQSEILVCGSLRDLIPDEHIATRVDQVLDLSWLDDELAELWAPCVGRLYVQTEVSVLIKG